jgi:integrase/recombinase XerD
MHSHSPMGPLAPYAEGFRAWLVSLGFAPASVKHRLTLFRQFSRWLAAQGTGLGELTDQQAERFVASRRAQGRVTWVSPAGMALPLRYLRGLGVVPPAAAVGAQDLLGEWLAAYGRYLGAERGLAASTVGSYLRVARRFLAGSATMAALEQLTAADVTAFVVAECGRSAAPSAHKTVTALGSLLRYLHIAGLTAVPLAAAVPRVAPRRPALAPGGYRPGRWRACWVAATGAPAMAGGTSPSCCCWHAWGCAPGRWPRSPSTISTGAPARSRSTARATGTSAFRCPRMSARPLPATCAAAASGPRRLPRSVPAPAGTVGRARPSGVCQVVRAACRRAGLPELGAHRLRHTAASGMLRAGAGLPEIAQALRHHSLAVTAAYAQPDPHALGELARPWPGGAA